LIGGYLLMDLSKSNQSIHGISNFTFKYQAF